MAATGGGKIRSRRSHIASKPYAKNKQQQTGLISRVTDTVKSIVPSWLQRYFKSGGSPGAVQGTEPNCQTTLPPNGSEEGPPPLDGRDSPEPSTSNAEPSTSRASLNFQEYVLSRPPLSRSHLHFPPLDASSPALGASSSLFSQPSTSSAPGPFSTGFSLVKEIKDNLSQHEDDNISTTSGFSSRASDKDVPNSKTASLPQLWSPETDRTNSGPQPSQSTLKKPAFNLSVFGNSSNSTLNSTILNSSQLGDSPFYPGKTMYGGAAAVKSSRARPGTPYQPPVRRQIKAKPAGAQPCGVTSATARRILQSLERMSSPLADAKRIPSASSPMSASLDGTNLDMSQFQAKKKRMEYLPPVQKLVVPSAVSASANRSVSFRPTLTPGVRTPRDTPTRQSPLIPETTPGPSLSTFGSGGRGYPLSSTPAVSAAGSGGGKMKRERSTTRPSTKRPDDDEAPEAPDLPAISLPISSTALPTFSFSSPVPPLTSATSSPAPNTLTTTPVKTTTINKALAVASSPPSVPFTFSSPIVKATAGSPPSFSPTAAGFTFSAPVAKLGSSMSNCNAGTSTMATVKPMANKSTEEFEGPFKPAKTLKQGSVLDLLKDPGFSSPVTKASDSEATPKQATAPYSSSSSTTTSSCSSSSSSSSGLLNPFKPPPGWSCDVCLVPNKSSDTKCVCCAAPQPNSSKSSESKTSAPPSIGLDSTTTAASTSTTSTTSGFGAMFSKPSGTWDCDTCLVQNKPEAVKCVACETAKPGTGLKSSLTLPSAFLAVKTVAPPTDPVSTVTTVGLGDKFKAPEGSWECDMCMVPNKAEDTKCVACTSPKPGAATTAPSVAASSTAAPSSSSTAPPFGFGDKFKTPEGDWECEVCLVSNKATDVQCVACTTAKPGAKVELKTSGTTFGSSANGTSSSSTFAAGGFKFGTADSTAPSSGSGGFKFDSIFPDASASSSSTSGGFKFGTAFGSSSSETTSKDTSAPSSGFKFDTSSEGFKFGTASSNDKTSEPPAASSGFKFGTSGGINFGTGSTSTESNSTNGGFTFGQSKPEEKSTESNSTPSTVTFAGSSQEKSDSPAPSSTNVSTSATKTSSIFGSLTSSTTPGGATFGSLTSEKDVNAAPTFTFGKPEEKRLPTPSAPSSFMFGAANKDAAPAPASTGGFSFSTPTTAAPSSDQPTFTFGKPADKSETTSTEPPKPVFSFGQSAADSAAASKPAFSFMTSTNPSANSTNSSTTSTPTPSLFGSSSSATPAPASAPSPVPFVFGQPAASSSSTDPPQTKAFMFGASQDSQPAAPSGPAPASAQPFIFGVSATAAPPASAAVAAPPSFNFGATAPPAASSAAPSAPSAASAPFSFSSASSGGFGTNQTPSFGSSFGSPFPAQSSQPPAFGAKPNAAPAFGQTNSTPVFGAAANSTPAGGGFPFGGASTFGASNSGSGVFAFGTGSAASAPPAAPSIAPQPGAAPGVFNFSQGPSFNIGSNKSFSSSPGGQPITGRRIKTAVRRRK